MVPARRDFLRRPVFRTDKEGVKFKVDLTPQVREFSARVNCWTLRTEGMDFVWTRSATTCRSRCRTVYDSSSDEEERCGDPESNDAAGGPHTEDSHTCLERKPRHICPRVDEVFRAQVPLLSASARRDLTPFQQNVFSYAVIVSVAAATQSSENSRVDGVWVASSFAFCIAAEAASASVRCDES